ncbi:MAG: AAA family ATPase [Planctomycetota bacterium]
MAVGEAAFPLLILVSDDSVADEIRGAISDAVDVPVNAFATTELTRAVDLARDRDPRAALIELSGDLSTDEVRIEELRSMRPDLRLVGVYSGESAASTLTSGEMVALVRSGVGDFIRRPMAAGELNGLFGRLLPSDEPATPSKTGTCIAMISNKGGVGKSTMAVNLAVSLARRHPDEVLLIDASLQMGVCAPMLDLSPETSLLDAFEQRQRLDSTLIRQLATPHESGLLLLAAPTDPVAAADIDDQAIARVLNLSRRTFQYVVVDTFPLFDQTIMSVLDVATRAYMVLDNVVPTVLSAVQLLGLLDKLQYPQDRVSVILNRYQQLAGNPLLDDISRSLRMDIDHVVPYDKRVITAANVGRPSAMDFVKWSKLHRAIKEIVDEVELLNVPPVPEDAS